MEGSVHPIRQEEEDVLDRLASRLEMVNGVLARLKERNAELEERLREALTERDAALAQAEDARVQAARLVEEADGLRARQQQAASRIMSLLSQMEQLDLQGDR